MICFPLFYFCDLFSFILFFSSTLLYFVFPPISLQFIFVIYFPILYFAIYFLHFIFIIFFPVFYFCHLFFCNLFLSSIFLYFIFVIYFPVIYFCHLFPCILYLSYFIIIITNLTSMFSQDYMNRIRFDRKTVDYLRGIKYLYLL